MNKRGLLIVVSGFSGSGKGTTMKRLLEKYTEYALSISATTRGPRAGEVEGREYFFKTKEEFEEMIAADELIEYAEYVHNYYGTPKEYVEYQRSIGKHVILEIEIQGALEIMNKFPDAISVFLSPPSAKELKKRLIDRGTEDMETIYARLSRAVEESEGVEHYDYIVVNDDLEVCVDTIHSIVVTEHVKAANNLDLIYNIREELKGFSEGDKQ